MTKSLALIIFLAATLQSDSRERERLLMVREQIADRGISDAATLSAIRSVPRHEFVPADWREHAYDDRPLPIGYGQTISQPYIVAYMTELMKPGRAKRVLEVGTGSGYQAAILARIVDSVFTLEIISELATEATKRLRSLGFDNVVAKNADGYFGWQEKGPFDAIVVTAAAEHIPPPLIAQLRDGGIMVIPVGTPFLVQTLTLVEKKGKKVMTRNLIPVRFVPLTRGK